MLSEILATKRTEVACLQKQVSMQLLQEQLIDAPPVIDFISALQTQPGPALIAEVKKASPSKGVIRQNFDPVEIARIFEANGASALSVLTDETYFQGHISYLKQIRSVVRTPILRKDFIIDPWQILQTRASGADALLLIAAALSPIDMKELLSLTERYEMSALMEVHNEEELDQVINIGAKLIGINNRDLHRFSSSLNVTIRLAKGLKTRHNCTLVSESGIFTREDVLLLKNAGVDAALVGEALMREEDIGSKVRELLGRE